MQQWQWPHYTSGDGETKVQSMHGQRIHQPQNGYLHNVAEDGYMTLVCEVVLDAWYFACLEYVS